MQQIGAALLLLLFLNEFFCFATAVYNPGLYVAQYYKEYLIYKVLSHQKMFVKNSTKVRACDFVAKGYAGQQSILIPVYAPA